MFALVLIPGPFLLGETTRRIFSLRTRRRGGLVEGALLVVGVDLVAEGVLVEVRRAEALVVFLAARAAASPAPVVLVGHLGLGEVRDAEVSVRRVADAGRVHGARASGNEPASLARGGLAGPEAVRILLGHLAHGRGLWKHGQDGALAFSAQVFRGHGRRAECKGEHKGWRHGLLCFALGSKRVGTSVVGARCGPQNL